MYGTTLIDLLHISNLILKFNIIFFIGVISLAMFKIVAVSCMSNEKDQANPV